MTEKDTEEEAYEQAKQAWGRALSRAREAKGLSQEQVAAVTRTTYQNVGHWEHGRSLPRLGAYRKLVELFGRDSPVAYMPGKTGTVTERMRQLAMAADDLYGPAPAPTQFEEQVATYNAGDQVKASRPSTFIRIPPARRGIQHVELVDSLRANLPAHLHKNLEVRDFGDRTGLAGRINLTLDYYSPNLLVEWKICRDHDIRQTFESGLLQLQLAKVIIQRRKAPEPAHAVLAIILDSGALTLGRDSPLLTTGADKAELLGVSVVVCSSMQALADTIIKYEDPDSPNHPDAGTW